MTSSTQNIQGNWNIIVPNEKLDTIFVMGDIVAGIEQGFSLPAAGMDWERAAENWVEFDRRAKEGDEEVGGGV